MVTSEKGVSLGGQRPELLFWTQEIHYSFNLEHMGDWPPSTVASLWSFLTQAPDI